MDSVMATTRGDGRIFLLALLLALTAVLIPALIHSGLPATRAIGSAFDPSTTVVAIRAAEATAFDPAPRERPKGAPELSAPDRAILPAPAPLVGQGTATRDAAPAPDQTTDATGLRQGKAALPRAPPLGASS